MTISSVVADCAAYGIIRNVEKEKEEARKKRDEERKKQEEVRLAHSLCDLMACAERAQGAGRGGRQIGRGRHCAEDAQGRRVIAAMTPVSMVPCRFDVQ